MYSSTAPVNALQSVPTAYFDTVNYLASTVLDVDPDFAEAAKGILEDFNTVSEIPLQMASNRLAFLITQAESLLGG